MRKIGLGMMMAALGFAAMPAVAGESVKVGSPAPDFVATDSNGQAVRLADLKGKEVVLEWTNDGCPYVGKWYRSGAMQNLQREAAKLGAVWLTIASSAPGEQGYVDAAQANADTKDRNADPAHVLLDPKGAIGRLYGAQTTPHIFVINSDGALAYMGGADFDRHHPHRGHAKGGALRARSARGGRGRQARRARRHSAVRLLGEIFELMIASAQRPARLVKLAIELLPDGPENHRLRAPTISASLAL